MKPILFNTEMVRAILEGRKTVTRRVVKPQPAGDGSAPEPLKTRPGYWNSWGDDNVYRPPYQPGDILWVRETWQTKRGGGYLYKADTIGSFDLFMTPEGRVVNYIPWRPSIHMPREVARVFLRVTGVRVERLQKITYDEAIREGADRGRALNNFEWIWNHTIKPADLSAYGWNANPWVWVFDFERISKEEAME